MRLMPDSRTPTRIIFKLNLIRELHYVTQDLMIL